MKKGKNKSSHDIKVSRKILLTTDTAFSIKEAYLKLRTNLTFCMCKNKPKPCKSFLVTSANPAEGKSVVTSNIAISFAMLGKKTLIVDCDMRKPMQGKIWKLEVENGIAEHLADLGECEFGMVDGDLPLYICCCNRIPSNPTEMLSSESMKELINSLYDKFDYIFIDTPPVNAVVDAQIIAPLVDGVILISKAGFTMRDELQAAKRLIEQAGGNLCGVVLNQIEAKSGRYGYKKYKYGYYKYGYYKRGYGYGYGYKYASDYESNVDESKKI